MLRNQQQPRVRRAHGPRELDAKKRVKMRVREFRRAEHRAHRVGRGTVAHRLDGDSQHRPYEMTLLKSAPPVAATTFASKAISPSIRTVPMPSQSIGIRLIRLPKALAPSIPVHANTYPAVNFFFPFSAFVFNNIP